MSKILKWIKYPLEKKKFSFFFYLYKIVFIKIKKKFSKVLDLVHFDVDKTTELKYTESANGKFLVFTNDGGISRQIFINKEYNLNSLKKVIKIIGKQNIIFDVGANLGTTCITALKQKYAKYSIAIEAEKNLFRLLNLNIQLNNMNNNIVPLNFAASDKHEYFDLIKNNKNYGANFIKKKANNKNLKNKIQSLKLDDLVKYLKKKTLIWIDVQGNESKVLKGSSKLIKKKIPFVIEFWPYGINRSNNKENLKKELEKFKYFFDLNYKKPIIKKISPENIEALFKKYNQKKATELLLINR